MSYELHQVITYLRLTGAWQARLINFNGITLKDGLKRFLGERNLRAHGRRPRVHYYPRDLFSP